MDWQKTCAAVVPCFNEEATIGTVVHGARKHLAGVFVVNDGSGDRTAPEAAAAGASVLNHERNCGKGAALRTGLSAALETGFGWAITLDGDGQHQPEDIPAFFARAEETGAVLVVGDRMHDACAMPWLRRQVNRWMSRRLSRKLGHRLPDTQSGFRLIHLKAWSALPLKTERFEVESEMLVAFARAGYRVEFVPIPVIGRSRCSHIHPVVDTWRWWRWWRGVSGASGG